MGRTTETLLIDGVRGIYVPAHFAEIIESPEAWNLDEGDVEPLRNGPADPEYWEAWDYCLENAYQTTEDGHCRLVQYPEGDVFLLREEGVKC